MNDMAFGPIMLLALLAGGGGSDLLDFIPLDNYWKAKQVQVSLDTMSGELKPPASTDVGGLIDDLNSPDAAVRQQASDKIAAAGMGAVAQLKEAAQSAPPQVAATARGLIARIQAAARPASVRRLMAIKELGQLKDPKAIPILQPLLQSSEPFVAEYAQAAIDKINGKEFVRPLSKDLRADIWLMPPDCRAVGQILTNRSTFSVEDALAKMPAMPGQDLVKQKEILTAQLTAVAEKLGNVRIEQISFGVSGDVGNQSGFVVLVARGLYDPHAAQQWMEDLKLPSKMVGGAQVFGPLTADVGAAFFPSQNTAVAIFGPPGQALPIESVVDALQNGHSKLKENAQMKKLIDAAPDGQAAWATMKVTPAFAQAPVFAPFDTVQLGSQSNEKSLSLHITASGTKPDQVKNVVQMISQGAKEGAQQVRQAAATFPPLKALADALDSVKCEATGGNATLTAQIPGGQDALLVLPWFGLLRAEPVRAVAPAPAQQPPPPPPQPPK